MANQKKEKSIQSTQSKTDKTRENKARENAGDQAVIDLVYIWLVKRKAEAFFDQSQSGVKKKKKSTPDHLWHPLKNCSYYWYNYTLWSCWLKLQSLSFKLKQFSYFGFPLHLCFWSRKAFLNSMVHVLHWNCCERHSIAELCSVAFTLSPKSSEQWVQRYLIVSIQGRINGNTYKKGCQIVHKKADKQCLWWQNHIHSFYLKSAKAC